MENGWVEKQAASSTWKSRLKRGKSIVWWVLVILFCYALYIVANIAVYKLGMREELTRFGETLVETHFTGLKADKSSKEFQLTPWLTQKATLTLYKQVGEWDLVVGTVELTKPLLGELHYELHYEPKDLHDRQGTFKFALAPDLLGRSPFPHKKEQDSVWDQLRHIEDGYVAEMSFATMTAQKPEALMALLKKYDVHVVQMPVYAGELKTFKTSAASSGDLTWVPHLSLRPAVFYEEDRVTSMQIYMDDEESAKMAASGIIADLEWLQSRKTNPFAREDAPRLDYLKQNGVMVYGAVVTGPVRELEKLRNEPLFHDFDLGRIEVWNW